MRVGSGGDGFGFGFGWEQNSEFRSCSCSHLDGGFFSLKMRSKKEVKKANAES